MEELKNLTKEQLMKVQEKITKELFNRRGEERKNAYEKLINAMKEFQDSDFFGMDYCSFEAYCEECESTIDIDLFECFDSIIEELERKI